MLKEIKLAKNTQEQIATKIGIRKSYISRNGNGKCDILLYIRYFSLAYSKK